MPLRPAKTNFCPVCIVKQSIQFGCKKGALHLFERLHVKENGMNIAVKRHGTFWQARVRFRGADGTIQEKSKSLGIPCAAGRGKKVARAAAENRASICFSFSCCSFVASHPASSSNVHPRTFADLIAYSRFIGVISLSQLLTICFVTPSFPQAHPASNLLTCVFL